MNILKVKQWKNDLAPTFKKMGAIKARRLSDGEIFERFVFYTYQVMTSGECYRYRIVDFHENCRQFKIQVFDHKGKPINVLLFNPTYLLKPET